MEELLRRLLNELSRLGVDHGEIFDSECREQMSRAVYDAFLKGTPNAEIGNNFGLHSEQGNQAVRKALADYIVEAKAKAIELGLIGFHARLSAFQNERVESENEGNYYDDFFGYWRAADFDENGTLLNTK